MTLRVRGVQKSGGIIAKTSPHGGRRPLAPCEAAYGLRMPAPTPMYFMNWTHKPGL
jgi:hypothetical protein